MTHETATTDIPRPVQDWENTDVNGQALCCDSVFEEQQEKVSKLRARQAAYEDSLPTQPDDAFKEINRALPYIEDLGEKTYGVRAALRVYNMVFTKVEPLDGPDVEALYWLNCQAEDAMGGIEAGIRRARDIAHKQIQRSDEQLHLINDMARKMEPEVAAGLTAMLEVVVKHGAPIEEAYAVFDKVVAEHREQEVA